jgi:signal peptidase
MRILAGTTTSLRRIVDVTLIVLIAVVLFGLILGKLVPLTGHRTIIIGGASMEPAIALGSAVVVAPVQPANLASGDVVSLQIGPDRATFTHRIVDLVTRADGLWIRTKGDANAEPDPTLVPATAVVGRVEWSIPWAGFLLAFLSLPVGILFVLGLAATLMAIAWLLESLESDDLAVVVHPVPDPAGGEPIAARPVVRRAFMPAAFATHSPAAAGSGGAVATFRDVARPTVPQQLARSRDNRFRRNRWEAAHEQRRPGPNRQAT